MPVYPETEADIVTRLIDVATADKAFRSACQSYAHANGTSKAIMVTAVNAFERAYQARDADARRRDAIRAVLTWISSDDSPETLTEIDLSLLTDADIETLFRGNREITRIPHLGAVT